MARAGFFSHLKKEAKQWRNMLITDVYPEIGHYLSDCEMETLADNLGCTEKQLWSRIAWKKSKKKASEEGGNSEDSKMAVSGGVRNIIRGKPVRHDGKEYSVGFIKKVCYCVSLKFSQKLIPGLEGVGRSGTGPRGNSDFSRGESNWFGGVIQEVTRKGCLYINGAVCALQRMS